MHIRSLHQSYIQELNEMDLYLEENLKKSVKTIVEQEFGSLKKKLLNDLVRVSSYVVKFMSDLPAMSMSLKTFILKILKLL